MFYLRLYKQRGLCIFRVTEKTSPIFQLKQSVGGPQRSMAACQLSALGFAVSSVYFRNANEKIKRINRPAHRVLACHRIELPALTYLREYFGRSVIRCQLKVARYPYTAV